MSKFLENSEAENPSTSLIERLPFELIGAILDYLDVTTLKRTIRTAKFLRYPSEQRVYHQVGFRALPNPWDAQACFLETVAETDRLGQHVVKLVLEKGSPVQNAEDARIHRSIGQAMKKLVNLKQLNIYGSSVIVNAHLDCVSFRLTHLVMSGEKTNHTDPDPPLLSILRAHPTLEELGLDFSELPRDLLSALRAEQEGLTSENDILCPKLKRFDGYDVGLQMFLPMRRIESVTSLGGGAKSIDEMDEYLSIWLNPILKPSYQHIRVLEARPDEDGNRWFFNPAITPYLKSLTHLLLFDSISGLHHHNYDIIDRALPQLQTLQSITTFPPRTMGYGIFDAEASVGYVRGALPDIQEIFVGSGEGNVVYYRYVNEGRPVNTVGWEAAGEGIEADVGWEVACKPYARWLHC